jgi:hypothetical protein
MLRGIDVNKLLRFGSSDQGSLPRLAAEVSVANSEVIGVAETLARQAAETSDDALRQSLLDAANRLLKANRTVNSAVETAIGPGKS